MRHAQVSPQRLWFNPSPVRMGISGGLIGILTCFFFLEHFVVPCRYHSITAPRTLTFQSLPVTWCTTSLTFNNCTLCPHCIYVFCFYLRTNSDLCHLQHKLIGFYNRAEKRSALGLWRVKAMFCIYLRTNSDFCHLQHKLIGFYNPDEKCLQRGTDWVFKYSGLRFGCKGLMPVLL